MNGGDGGTRALVPPYRRIRAHRGRSGMGVPVHWRDEVRAAVRAHLNEFVDAQCRTDLGAAKVDVAGEILSGLPSCRTTSWTNRPCVAAGPLRM